MSLFKKIQSYEDIIQYSTYIFNVSYPGSAFYSMPNQMLMGYLKKSDIRAYYQDFAEGSTEWRVIKALILGNGRIGKSTLAHVIRSTISNTLIDVEV